VPSLNGVIEMHTQGQRRSARQRGCLRRTRQRIKPPDRAPELRKRLSSSGSSGCDHGAIIRLGPLRNLFDERRDRLERLATVGEFRLGELTGDVYQQVDVVGLGLPVDDRRP
jgi:hypothetical protein